MDPWVRFSQSFLKYFPFFILASWSNSRLIVPWKAIHFAASCSHNTHDSFRVSTRLSIYSYSSDSVRLYRICSELLVRWVNNLCWDHRFQKVTEIDVAGFELFCFLHTIFVIFHANHRMNVSQESHSHGWTVSHHTSPSAMADFSLHLPVWPLRSLVLSDEINNTSHKPLLFEYKVTLSLSQMLMSAC